MWDDSARPWDPQCGFFNRVYEAIGGGKQNMLLGQPVVAVQIPALDTFQLDLGLSCTFNPSLARHGDEIFALVRTLKPNTTQTLNFLGRIANRRIEGATAISHDRVAPTLQGYEDCRIFVFGGKLWATGAFAQPDARGGTTGVLPSKVALLEVASDHFTEAHHQETGRYEKNWLPIVDIDPSDGKERLRILYASDPTVVLGWDHGSKKIATVNLPDNCGILRGGAAPIRYGDGWLAIVHEVAGGQGHESIYTQRFVRFALDFSGAPRVGKGFYFQKRGVEFCSGLVKAPSDDSYFLGYGVEDSAGLTGAKRAFVCEIDATTIEDLLTP